MSKFHRIACLELIAAFLLLSVTCHKANQPPLKPSAPSGPSHGRVSRSYGFKVVATDPESGDVAYRLDFGDSITDWSSRCGSGQPASFHRSWPNIGTYNVKVQACDTGEKTSPWSDPLAVLIDSSFNNPPDTPAITKGPAAGKAGSSLTFSASASDPDCDRVAIRFDWGDSSQSDWSSLVCSDSPVQLSHDWFAAGDFEVKAQARDSLGATSGWSGGRKVKITGTSYPGRVVDSVVLGHVGNGAAALPHGDSVYVVGDIVSVIRTRDDRVTTVRRIGTQEYEDIVAGPGGDFVYISPLNPAGTDTVSYIYFLGTSDDAVHDSVAVGTNVSGMAVQPDGQFLYVACNNQFGQIPAAVYVINLHSSAVDTILPVGNSVAGLTVLPDGSSIYVISDSSVKVIRTLDRTTVATIPFQTWVGSLAALPSGDCVYAACGDRSVKIIRTSDNTVVGSIPLEYQPYSVCALPDGKLVYASDWLENTISVIRTSNNTVVDTVHVFQPRAMAALPDNSRVYVGALHGVYVLGF